jgi:hypothetical protein
VGKQLLVTNPSLDGRVVTPASADASQGVQNLKTFYALFTEALSV